MTEYEQAEQDVAAAKVAERIAEWKAMEAKATYYRCASEAMAASAELMGSRIRRDNAIASEFVEKAQVNAADAWMSAPPISAALSRSPDFSAEKAVAREQLEREPDAPLPGIDDIIDPDFTGGLQTEVYLERLHAGTLRGPDPDEQDDASEFVSDLTGDPAIEPESGLHGENPVVIKPYRVTRDLNYEKAVEFFVTEEEATARYNDLLGKPHDGVWLSVLRDGVWLSVAALDEAPALNEAMQDAREQTVTDVAALIASGEHSYDEVAAIAYPEPDGYAPVTNPEAHIQAVEAERYAQPTNPDADALAKAHDWYDPKAVADRERNAGMARLFSYNPFYKPKVDA